jgi:hypothetical protein
MKKAIFMFLTIATIMISGWAMVKNIDKINILTTDFEAVEKERIIKDTTILACEKKIQIMQLDFEKSKKLEISQFSFSMIRILGILIILQLTALLLIIFNNPFRS